MYGVKGIFKKQLCRLLVLVTAVMLAGCGKEDSLKATQTIALFTDFGEGDAYVAQVKGAIKSINPKVEIMDLIHETENFNIEQASYLLDKAARFFPEGIIFVAVVDPGVGTSRKGIVLKTRAGKVYVGPDNGIFTRVIQREGLAEARELNQTKLFLSKNPSKTFHGRDVFGPVAAHISRGMPLSKVGVKMLKLTKHPIDTPTVLGSQITGEIIHADKFGNLITNITAREVKSLKPGQLIRLVHHRKTRSLPFCRTYGEAPKKRLFALLNSDGELELALPRGNAARFLGAKAGDKIAVKF